MRLVSDTALCITVKIKKENTGDLQGKLLNGSTVGEGVKIREKPGKNRRVDRSAISETISFFTSVGNIIRIF